jgi:hypothetical protein
MTNPGSIKLSDSASRVLELKALKALLEESRSYYRGHPDESKTALGTNFAAGISTEENAAWVAVARIVLNMDEFITRE